MKSDEWWAMYDMFAMLLLLLSMKELPGRNTEALVTKYLKTAAPYLGEQQVKDLEKVLDRG